MGYTHYFTQKRNFTKIEWAFLCEAAQAIVQDVQYVQGISLACEYDEPKQPVIDSNEIRFNGVGEDGHETFILTRVREPKQDWQVNRGFAFCKTARKPYDLAVTAILAVASTCIERSPLDVNSDGTPEEWVAGVEEARRAYPPCANQVDIPMQLLKDAVWDWRESAGFKLEAPFQVGRAVDGFYYVVRKKDEASCRLDSEEHFLAVKKRIDSCYENVASRRGGWTDNAARSQISRRQSMFLNDLVGSAEPFGRKFSPPALVRPGMMPEPAVPLPETILI